MKAQEHNRMVDPQRTKENLEIKENNKIQEKKNKLDDK